MNRRAVLHTKKLYGSDKLMIRQRNNGYTITLSISILLGIGLLVVSGCGDSAKKVKGQLKSGEKNYALKENEYLIVTFHPKEGDGSNTYVADLNPDGSFVVTDGADGGIPPGKYRVTIEDGQGGVAFGGKFTGDESPLVVEVVEGEETIKPIDVGPVSP